MCEYCTAGLKHPQFVTLVIDGRASDAKLCANEYGAGVLDFSRQPLVRLACHNRERRYRRGPKSTKSAAPHNRILLTAGPFQHNALVFTKVLKACTRKFAPRVAALIELARLWTELDPTQHGVKVDVRRDQSRCEMVAQIEASEQVRSEALASTARRMLMPYVGES